MKNNLLLLITIIIICTAGKIKNNPVPYSIEIIQNGIIHKPENGIFKIKKEPFKYMINLDTLEGIHLHHSFDSKFSKKAHEGRCKATQCCASSTCVEANFNKEKTLLISKYSFCYWFYNPDQDWHRMDSIVEIDKGSVTIFKTIEHLNDLEADLEYPINKVQSPLYVTTFNADKYDDESIPMVTVLNRFIIRWQE